MDSTGVSRIRERVERFLAEEHPERLSDTRDSMRRHPELRSDARSGRRFTKTLAGIEGWAENLIPLLHLRRALRGTPAPLETLRYRCWETGFRSGIEIDGRHDFECVLDRWARHRREEDDVDAGRTEPEDLAGAVVRRLRASRFWKLALGFVPIVGPVAAYLIDAALALRFHDRATGYFSELRAAGVRHLPADFAIPARPRPRRDRKKDRFPVSVRREVRRYLSDQGSEEQLRQIRRTARLGNSVRQSRIMAGSWGFAVYAVPVLHLWLSRIDTGMLLSLLQGICWHAGVKAAREADHFDDFEQVLLQWTGRNRDGEVPSPEELIAAVSAKLRVPWLWKLAFGFLPVVGPLLGLVVNGSMAAGFYRLVQRYHEERKSPAPIVR